MRTLFAFYMPLSFTFILYMIIHSVSDNMCVILNLSFLRKVETKLSYSINSINSCNKKPEISP